MAGVGWGESAKLSGVEVTEGLDDAPVLSVVAPEKLQEAFDQTTHDAERRTIILPGGCVYSNIRPGMDNRTANRFFTDESGNPNGGVTSAPGVLISWQRGPMVIDGIRVGQNGAFVEDVITAAVERLKYFQSLKFQCSENMVAITHLEAALRALQERTASREQRGVEGTHSV